jgi:hypothetical protein
MPDRAILYSEMTPEVSHENEFNEWYDDEHIPLRTAVPGFRNAQRYRVRGTRNYLVVYEMDSSAVLQSAAYLAVKNNPSARTKTMLGSVTGFTRYIAEETGHYGREVARADALNAPCLYSVFFDVPPERHAEFTDWYNNEYIPLLFEYKDWLLVRRFRIVDGEPESWTDLALHYLKDERVPTLPERYHAKQTLHHKHGSRQ